MADLDLGDLQIFAAVARARSFRAVARMRNVSPSGLSDAMRRLEARLGVRLLHRTTRSVTPTDAGQRLLERLAPALADVSDALDALNGFRASPVGTFRLNVPVVAARLVLPGLLARFCAAYPGVTVEVIAEDAFVDVLGAGFDAGIRYDERLERDMVAVPIGPREQAYVTAAAPAYLAHHGTPAHPDELLDHACICHRFLNGHPASPWEFERAGETVRVTVRGPVVSNDLSIELAAAAAGLGVIHTFDGFLAPAIAAGSLVAILQDWSPRFPGPFLYFAGRRQLPAPLRAFVDFIRADRIPEAAPAPPR